MPFDIRAFSREKFEPRTASVPVPSLRQWFGENDEPVFVVRGLDGNELANCNQAISQQNRMDDIVKAISANNSTERIEQIRSAIGISGDDVPEENIKRFKYLEFGSVEPKVDHDLAKIINQRFPIEFKILTNKIIELTGLGMDVKKPEPSGERA